MSEGLTISFELPVGYEDAAGVVHKTVEMRRLKNADIIAIQADIELKALAGQNVDMFSGNPAMELRAAAATAQVYAILYSRVVLSIGTLAKPRPEVFHDLFVEDAAALYQRYCELNKLVVKQGDSVPFARGANS